MGTFRRLGGGGLWECWGLSPETVKAGVSPACVLLGDGELPGGGDQIFIFPICPVCPLLLHFGELLCVRHL